ncbi:hypothetical protein K501DRAFT_264332 [Backusella circina FSU 941]|nr:hypothetical protein K501DRAFT_234519 [Backusella circina FSU 941]KAI8875025.1 hypothetical protein K501DRAFT_264332 [Backusella circina FSU 941]
MSTDNINNLAQEFQELRNNADTNEEKKLQVMKALGDQLGLPGTPAAIILSSLGKPDELSPSLQNMPASVLTMPGPAIPSGASAESGQQQAYYFRYYVQPKKDFLYFKIDNDKETVITSGWQKPE